MAQEARRRKVPEPEPSALAHRALRAKLAAADDAAGLEAVIGEIKAFFPAAANDRASARVNLARWEAPYADDPAEAYRDRAPADRPQGARSAALGRRPGSGCWIASRSRTSRPASPSRSRRRACSPRSPTSRPACWRRPSASTGTIWPPCGRTRSRRWPQVYREKLQQPDEAQKVLRDWLEIKRTRLSETDAEGPVSLANLYEELLQDRVTAVELLRKAWKIDPSSKEIAEAFRSRGFRKLKDDWVESAPQRRARPGARQAESRLARPPTTQGLLGLTPDEVRQKLSGQTDSRELRRFQGPAHRTVDLSS